MTKTSKKSKKDNIRSAIEVDFEITKYLKENRKPFTFNSMLKELIENNIISQDEVSLAEDTLNGMYENGYIVIVIINGEDEEDEIDNYLSSRVSLVFTCDVDYDIIHYLKNNSGRESTFNILLNMGHLAHSIEETKCCLVDLLDDGEIGYDSKTEEYYII